MEELEIERKFFAASENPSLQKMLSDHKHNVEDRYYLYRKDGIEIRFTKITKPNKGVFFNFDRMEVALTNRNSSHSKRKKQRWLITQDEFNSLLQLIDDKTEPIIRWSYLVSNNPKIEIKVYKNRFEGLNRVEVEFPSEAECANFTPEEWFSKEITDLTIGRDTNLPDLTDSQFYQTLESLK